MSKLAAFYSTSVVDTHGSTYAAYYAGRNHCANGDKALTRDAFKTDDDYDEYKRGWRHVAGEDRLNDCTEWDQ